jgi:hypothetical protein
VSVGGGLSVGGGIGTDDEAAVLGPAVGVLESAQPARSSAAAVKATAV